ncbi:hypothetical protein G7Y89_g12333 [Cudoniella acicularis]|uniref:Uncharacterized protein n=1 Tax=Cudoniella acicularis TaxID=354080 RepID=A0A8H4RAM4_9HELO|nr:hypothetical protein G7Y89_g12333 [Cudoniella acicularis]
MPTRKLPLSAASTGFESEVSTESLRLHPPVPVNSRAALKTTALPTGGGPDRKSPILVPKGTSVAYSIYTMHRGPDIYGMDAEIFRPERWDEETPLNSNEANAKWGYLPFNSGPRICLDMDFALIEVAYTVLEGASDIPNIFLCHSLGGIIVKRALIYYAAGNGSGIAHLNSIFTSTYAVMFLGTPHKGPAKARLLGSLQKPAALAIPKRIVQFESALLHALKERSETLQNITDQFAPLMSRFRMLFWEQEKMNLKYTQEYIVEESSAAPIISNTKRCGIAANHREMG